MKILNISNAVIYENENIDNMKELVEEAAEKNVSLKFANLRGADLTGADLARADLRDTDRTDRDED